MARANAPGSDADGTRPIPRAESRRRRRTRHTARPPATAARTARHPGDHEGPSLPGSISPPNAPAAAVSPAATTTLVPTDDRGVGVRRAARSRSRSSANAAHEQVVHSNQVVSSTRPCVITNPSHRRHAASAPIHSVNCRDWKLLARDDPRNMHPATQGDRRASESAIGKCVTAPWILSHRWESIRCHPSSTSSRRRRGWHALDVGDARKPSVVRSSRPATSGPGAAGRGPRKPSSAPAWERDVSLDLLHHLVDTVQDSDRPESAQQREGPFAVVAPAPFRSTISDARRRRPAFPRRAARDPFEPRQLPRAEHAEPALADALDVHGPTKCTPSSARPAGAERPPTGPRKRASLSFRMSCRPARRRPAYAALLQLVEASNSSVREWVRSLVEDERRRRRRVDAGDRFAEGDRRAAGFAAS